MYIDLQKRIDAVPQADYPIHSRIHRLKTFTSPNATYYLKRDDELGFGISGSKIRKYRTLIPFLVSSQFDEVIVIGSLNSNNVLGISQVLIENQLKPKYFLRGDPKRHQQGNSLLLSLFIDFNTVRWFQKNEWKGVEKEALKYAAENRGKVFIIKEGGSVKESLPGALTLPLDILQNEKNEGIAFDHIFIDAGTGLMASSLILAFSLWKRRTHIHVVLIAGDRDYFISQLSFFHKELEKFLQTDIPFPQNFTLYYPKEDFGKINDDIFKDISSFAKQEGIFTDPIYTAKLLTAVKNIGKDLQGNILINHSGGGLSLFGFLHNPRNGDSKGVPDAIF